MDPITIGLVLLGSWLMGGTCGVIGAAIQRRLNKRRGYNSSATKRLALDNKRLERLNGDLEDDLGDFDKVKKGLIGQRDEYRRIAESHDVKLPGPATGEEYEWAPVRNFSPRRYDLDIGRALESVNADLGSMGEGHVEVTFRLWLGPRWVQYMHAEASGWSFGQEVQNLRRFGKMDATFTGPPSEVAKEIEQHLKDSSWGLRLEGDDGKWQWRCNNRDGVHSGFAPVRIELEVREQRPVVVAEQLQVHTVEVAVVQEVEVVREVERVRYVVWDNKVQQAAVVDSSPAIEVHDQKLLSGPVLSRDEVIDIA